VVDQNATGRRLKYGYAAIPELFMPLVEELRQERETWLTNWRAQSASDSGMERAMTMLAADMFDNRRLNSVEPDVHNSGAPLPCRHCGRKFFNTFRDGGSLDSFCSDKCIIAHKNESHIARVSSERRRAREGRACEHCGSPIAAERSSKRYCSNRCRIAALRARRASL